VNGVEGLWEKAFQLAYFIVLNRSKACQIVGRALERVGAQRSRERRRIYWRGRDASLKIRKISRPDADALQWLVFVESEEYEKEQERNNQQTEADMIIRYIKHLVQVTAGMSSFYVNVGLNRLLRNYSTPEVQQVYEWITEHYPASEEYRKVKGRLMGQLTSRFEQFLQVCTTQYRELRFETCEDQERWLNLVEECLETFTPWTSRKACFGNGSVELKFGDPGAGARHSSFRNELDGIETSRCHWFMHSPCYCSLTKRLGLDSPQGRLAVPRFTLKNNGQDGSNFNAGERKAAALTPAELGVLRDRVTAAEAKRRAIPLQPVKIVVQGVVRARLNPSKNERREFDIQEGAKLLEVVSDAQGTDAADLVLASHWIDYTEWNGIVAGEYTIPLKRRRELLLKIVPVPLGSAQEGGATVVVESRSSVPLAAWFSSLALLLRLRQNLARYAFASVILVALGWLAMTANYRSRLAQQQRTIDQMATEIASLKTTIVSPQLPPPQASSVPSYFLASTKPSVRGPHNPEEPIVTFAPGAALVMLQLPVAEGEHGSYRATLTSFLDERELVRENALKPARKHKDWVVEFALPSALVTNNTHYLVTLAAVDHSGRSKNVGTFVFKIRK